MITIPGRKTYFCDGPTRRELLRVGSIGLLEQPATKLNTTKTSAVPVDEFVTTDNLVGSMVVDLRKQGT